MLRHLISLNISPVKVSLTIVNTPVKVNCKKIYMPCQKNMGISLCYSNIHLCLQVGQEPPCGPKPQESLSDLWALDILRDQ